MRRLVLVGGLAAGIVGIAVALGAAPTEKPETPKAVVTTYLQDWRDGKVCLGIHQYWDLDTTLRDVFDADYTALSAADRQYLQDLFTVFITLANRSPGVMANIRAATVDLGEPTTVGDARQRVPGRLTGPNGPLEIYFELVKTTAGWRIVQLGNNGKDLRALAETWKAFKAAKPTATPIEMSEMILTHALVAKYQPPTQ